MYVEKKKNDPEVQKKILPENRLAADVHVRLNMHIVGVYACVRSGRYVSQTIFNLCPFLLSLLLISIYYVGTYNVG